MPDIVIPKEYGYVIATFGASALYLFNLGIQTGLARKAAGVPYPYAYAEKSEAEKDPKKHIFNCAQRVQQNTLEMFPVYSIFLCIAGIRYPVYASAAGVWWLLNRIVYSRGYMSGKPEKRARGVLAYLGLFGLIGMSGSTVYHLLQ
ncbi:microsomal glutathione s-transferase 3-likeprotein [Lichtheimia corymbifera JMRC:FSU:9682]|uniref:Glutathione S-transferase 3, mitochondrial n=1 Tax=Lichtheimia corymbifera JMRC:FSU:9682 TaxID=1263082 RepID=A0A068S825_9FUNG|nr:microsomal glutathione s-transferase 3-likeprotein [Lichtheimia corymbifera JMRC:FSU:9682]